MYSNRGKKRTRQSMSGLEGEKGGRKRERKGSASTIVAPMNSEGEGMMVVTTARDAPVSRAANDMVVVTTAGNAVVVEAVPQRTTRSNAALSEEQGMAGDGQRGEGRSGAGAPRAGAGAGEGGGEDDGSVDSQSRCIAGRYSHGGEEGANTGRCSDGAEESIVAQRKRKGARRDGAAQEPGDAQAVHIMETGTSGLRESGGMCAQLCLRSNSERAPQRIGDSPLYLADITIGQPTTRQPSEGTQQVATDVRADGCGGGRSMADEGVEGMGAQGRDKGAGATAVSAMLLQTCLPSLPDASTDEGANRSLLNGPADGLGGVIEGASTDEGEWNLGRGKRQRHASKRKQEWEDSQHLSASKKWIKSGVGKNRNDRPGDGSQGSKGAAPRTSTVGVAGLRRGSNKHVARMEAEVTVIKGKRSKSKRK